MAETFATDIAKSLLRKLGSFAAREFCLAWGLEGGLARLEETLSAINAVLSDAESKQSQNDSIRFWLQKLKEVLYDAEDVLDELEMSHKINDLIDRLVEIASLQPDCNLNEQTIDYSHVLHEETEMRPSFESFSCLIGRDKDEEPLPMSPNKLHRVRSVLFDGSDIEEPRCKTDCGKCLIEFKRVRSLELLDGCELLPERIGALKHLRYFNLVRNSKLKRLPKSVFKLQNLQALLLGYGFEELPEDVRYMISLRFLFLITKQKRLPEGGIGCLKCLQVLFISMCDDLEYLCEDMQGLKSLRKLGIVGCKSLISLPRSMKYLTALEFLGIVDCEKLDLATMEEEHEKEIKPLRLQTVIFAELPATLALPKQILQGSADTLQTFMIGDCPNIRELPECISNLKKLQNLEIKSCPTLSQRCQRETGEDWPKIAHIPKIDVDDYDNDEETSN
ncbi:unnamed protein product [Dovyalis caffra]|uniref:Rx N-terminal domain-containing protein n=1 Tax=Dovyalis caffra TaxID=77055 RepID=A0AAV1RR89_9ROSI|nr:unnamed protein product [Dovyalis caffra]